MPDYLQHLASRITGLTPAVQPRLPSLFEPVQPRPHFFLEPRLKLPDLGVQPAFANRIEGVETSFQALPPPVSPQLVVPTVFQPSSIGSRETYPRRPSVSPSPQEPSLSSSEIRARQPVAPAQIRKTEDREDREVWARRSLHLNSSPTVLPVSISAETYKKGEDPERFSYSTRLQGSRPAIVPRAEAIHHPKPTRERAHPTVEVRAANPQRGAFSGHAPFPISPKGAQAAQSERQRLDSEESSVREIHVVIGTVTVQAIMPPQVVPASQVRPTPKLTLEQYLQQREGRL